MPRIALVQPAIPHYRVPVFNLLAEQPGVALTVFNGADEVSPAAASSMRFEVVEAPQRGVGWSRGALIDQPGVPAAADADRFDLLIMPWNVRMRSVWSAMGRARRAGLPVVLWGHGFSKRPQWLSDRLRVSMGRRADGVMFYTRTVADRWVREHGFDPGRVFVASNTLDLTPMHAAAAAWRDREGALASFAAERGLDPEQTLIHVSRLLSGNRPGMLVEAVARLRDRFAGVKLVLVGKGPAEADLRAQAEALGVGDRVVFAGAIYDEDRLAPWMLNASVFCYPVEIGLSLHHAFAYGLPVVTGDHLAGHNPEIELLIDGENGLLYRHGDVGDLADRCATLLAAPVQRRAMGEAGHRRVVEDYPLSRMVQGFLDATRLADGVQRVVKG